MSRFFREEVPKLVQVRGKPRRPRRLTAASLAVASVAAALVVSGVVPLARSAAGQAAPVIDPSYMYGQLFNLAYDDVYRVSAADGDPRNFSHPYNNPSPINGSQEF